MSSPVARGTRTQSGSAATPLLVAAPVVGLMVSIGLDWLISDPAPRPDEGWPVIAVLIGVVVLVLAVAAAAARLRQGGWPGNDHAGVGRPLRASLVGGLVAVGLGLALTLNEGGEWGEAVSPGIVLALIVLIAAIAALIVLFTVLRRRSQ
jgi:hypothetical protein